MNYEAYNAALSDSFHREMTASPADWCVSERLHQKITPDGRMNDFYGATAVIKLSDEDKIKCTDIQERLFQSHSSMLVKLIPETFHLTIHALGNVSNINGDIETVRALISKYEDAVQTVFREIRRLYVGEQIRMRSMGASTSGQDVVSLKFAPDSERDFTILIDMFHRLEAVFPLGRPFVPHVSLAYFRPLAFDKKEAVLLHKTLERVRKHAEFDIVLDVYYLVYQYHTHMNDFRDVFSAANVDR
ncbi:2'-5' RNA ligase family protein [Paenibacillus sp. NPDC056579]|uniref:2'-5' RNA ligase family protein n=1 Tax=Paenibacillus sp. NPDC056579 TaxID=3345871 RepID=UPI00367F07B9